MALDPHKSTTISPQRKKYIQLYTALTTALTYIPIPKRQGILPGIGGGGERVMGLLKGGSLWCRT